MNNPVTYVDPSGNDFGLTAFLVSLVIAALIGATTAGIQSNWNGKAMLMGAAMGAVSGACFYGAGYVIQEMAMVVDAEATAASGASYSYAGTEVGIGTKIAVHATAGAVSGGINAAIAGSDVGRGAAVGAVSAGLAKGLGGDIPADITGNGYADFGIGLAAHAAIGGITGGVTSSMYGGNFGEGFEQGAITGASGYLFNQVAHQTSRGLKPITGQTRTPTDPPPELPMQYEKGLATYWSCAGEKIWNILTPLSVTVLGVAATPFFPVGGPVLAVTGASWMLAQTANDVAACRARAGY